MCGGLKFLDPHLLFATASDTSGIKKHNIPALKSQVDSVYIACCTRDTCDNCLLFASQAVEVTLTNIWTTDKCDSQRVVCLYLRDGINRFGDVLQQCINTDRMLSACADDCRNTESAEFIIRRTL